MNLDTRWYVPRQVFPGSSHDRRKRRRAILHDQSRRMEEVRKAWAKISIEQLWYSPLCHSGLFMRLQSNPPRRRMGFLDEV